MRLLLEPLRPVVKQVVLDLLARRHFGLRDVHETRTGTCRLLAPLTHDLAAAIPTYAAAPIAEQVAHALAAASPGKISLTTPLSRANTANAQVRGRRSANRQAAAPVAIGRLTCRMCGDDLYGAARQVCPACWPIARYAASSSTTGATDLPSGWTFERYGVQIAPALAAIPLPEIERATGLSHASCSRVRSGKQIPNPRHWFALAAICNVAVH